MAGTSIEVQHADRLGSIRAVSDASGAVIATYRTDEFGVPTSSTGASGSPFRYTGEPLDASGLTYLRARYYDPSLGRFMSRDPFAGAAWAPTSLNRFAYVDNNPTRFTDPSGRCVQALVLAFAGPPGAVAGGGITLSCFAVVAVVAAGAAWVTGSALGEATGPVIEEIRADPTQVEWTPPVYDQPPAPRLPGGDPSDPDPFSALTGVFALTGVSLATSIVASALFGWDVHLGEPLVEPNGPDDAPGKSRVLQHGM